MARGVTGAAADVVNVTAAVAAQLYAVGCVAYSALLVLYWSPSIFLYCIEGCLCGI